MPNENTLIVGSFVRQRGNPALAGVIQDIREIRGRLTAQVQFPNGARRVPLEQLELVPSVIEDPSDLVRKGQFSGPASLRQRMAHVRLSGNLKEIFYSMESTDTDFYAHQFKPVVKMLDSPTGNLLIADEVGLGKTIEAGLIWTELAARFKYNRLLIVCPKVLCEKWRIELTTKFGIDARITDASSLRDLLSSSFSQRSGFAAICGMQGIRPRPKGKRTERPADKLAEVLEDAQTKDKLVDLLIIDEAHHMRNFGTQTNRLGELLCGITQHTAMLSATPLNLHNRDLHTLLRLLDELTFRDEQALNRIIKANQPLISARDAVLSGKPMEEVSETLDIAALDPILRNTRALKKLRKEIAGGSGLNHAERAQIARRLERVNLLSNVVNRTRRRDVEEFRVDRNVSAFRADMTDNEREVYDQITSAILNYAWENDLPVGFLTVMPQRMVASCLPAALEHWGSSNDAPVYEDEDYPDEADAQAGPLTRLLTRITATLPSSAELEKQDTKFQKFMGVIQKHISENPEQKIIVFSTFIPTLRYLKRRLEAAGIGTRMLHGGTEDRVNLIEDFETSENTPILLASEVGSEGIDLQFAQVLVNYDLPWNPMRVEQRIGRIDRLGQKSESVSILNLLHRNTVDERIYHRLHERLGLCKMALGGFEEILGQEIDALTSDLLSGQLSIEEQERRLEQAEQAIANKRQEEKVLEKEAAALIAHGDYILDSIREAQGGGGWISEGDIVDYLQFALGTVDPNSDILWRKSEGLVEILLTGSGKHDYEDWCSRHNLNPGPLARNTSPTTFRVGTEQTGQRHPRLGPSHPLVRFLSNALSEEGGLSPNAVALILDQEQSEGLEPGIYVGSIQAWQFGSGASSTMLGYGLVDTHHEELLSPAMAERVLSNCLKYATKWHGAMAEVSPEDIADQVLDLVEPDLASRFFDEGERRKAEVEDRVTIQLQTLEEHGQSQRLRFEDIIRRSGPRLEAANRARLRQFEETLNKRRRKIEAQQIEETSFSSVCAVLLKVIS
ncbi:hypothetical protein K3718_10035 [Leisingera aquaemixtae]|uniref:RNA polymerase-associated protein RapA n=1 Tax=Leisingera aquaemixtae TaxID=1396826 RepID=A0ABY5WEN7_9RHOB|nr:helicase-related protein [Leisingera aquaemixtae]UWQ39927.1 hypothetical protein K3718_10035 [Leisingera aquaemixtae]